MFLNASRYFKIHGKKLKGFLMSFWKHLKINFWFEINFYINDKI